MKTHHRIPRQFVVLAIIASAACGEEKKTVSDSTTAAPVAQPATGPQTPDPGGKVIPVEMATDAKGNNSFTPNNVEASKGDVIRYTLVQGVHNVHFLPDSNPGVTGLPPASQLLQLPGQTEDVKVTWGAGRYYFQCDPHALLGMVGHVVVK
ncbi:MAG: plastocyanin/azurin family copper-binding protein [Gemmatimonadaceae bacterium]